MGACSDIWLALCTHLPASVPVTAPDEHLYEAESQKPGTYVLSGEPAASAKKQDGLQ